jgi:cell wall-associated NlpC family hydrolase
MHALPRRARRVLVITAATMFGLVPAAAAFASPAHHHPRRHAHHTTHHSHRHHHHARRQGGAKLGERAVRIASHQRGKPYVWGAAGPHAFDCSGLVKYVYDKLGVHLPHHAATQYTRTRHVSHHAERPGDLIFFALAGGGTRAIDHVGIYSGHHAMWVARHTGTTITREHIWTHRYWVGRVR